MLVELHIAGLGVIDDVTLDLAPGLNVLTGETGAGKTMITMGLGLALGQRARTGLVRSGAARGSVEARFDVSNVPAGKEWAEDGDLVLARTTSADGRSGARAGGRLAPLSTLADLGAALVEVHGQHQTQRVLSPEAQLGFLDRYAGPTHLEVLDGYRDAYERLVEVRARLERLDDEAREREREKDLLAYQTREIEAAGISPGEADRLAAEESRLAHAERIRELLGAAGEALGGEGGGADLLRAAAAAAGEAAELDPSAEDLARRLESLAAEGADSVEALRASAEGVELDPAALHSTRERIAALRDLERKYGEGDRGILGYLERASRRLADLEGAVVEREGLAAEGERFAAEVSELARALSSGRKEAAPRLGEAIETELRDLGMEGVSLEVRLRRRPEPGPSGVESAEILFSGGPGQDPQPLQRVASGGELSRTMLACRTVLADLDHVPTLVFDEVDSGIGGRAGVAVGRRLGRLGRSRQVLVVTHLPQIACFADRHFRVSKDGGSATVTRLEDHQRVEELSRMISGMPTEEAATHAQQLLSEAARDRAEVRDPASAGR